MIRRPPRSPLFPYTPLSRSGKPPALAAVQPRAPPPAGASGKSWHGTIAASGWRCAPATHFPEPAVSEPSFAVPPTEPPDYDAFLRAHVLSQPLSIQRYDREDETKIG